MRSTKAHAEVRTESGELRMSINQLNALFKNFMQFYAYFSHFLTLKN
ncbi:hypothetical protein N44_04340 [Microcystis aeruginosa NIES-44]|uniref:Uncharacterized protein n=1 Tax=Microcystis aeruginosa NIES-44 TaxID=449439 RepID=A0A0A1W0K5_MICAE|nr:hypothetical protein N44_04340 [Microcystis aeruginosa NIES-44]